MQHVNCLSVQMQLGIGYKYRFSLGTVHSQFDPASEQKYPSITKMFKVCLALFFVVSILAQNARAFGCQNEGQTCNVMNGYTCCNGLTCQYAMGNIKTCQRSTGGVMGCRRRNEECKINGMPAMSCCASLRCLPGYMNRMTCQ